jgi:hypothetical protein
MTVHNITQTVEIKFWDVVYRLLNEKGPIMKLFSGFSRLIHTKAGFLTLLIIIWSAIGLLIGLILGQILWLTQLV